MDPTKFGRKLTPVLVLMSHSFEMDAYYRATLCVSAVFAVVRCLSIRLSVCHIGGLDCIHTAEDIVKLLVRPGIALYHSSFLTPQRHTQSKGNPFSLAQNTRGVKMLRFHSFIHSFYLNRTNGRLKSPFISLKRYEIGCYGMLIGSHRRWIDPCRFR